MECVYSLYDWNAWIERVKRMKTAEKFPVSQELIFWEDTETINLHDSNNQERSPGHRGYAQGKFKLREKAEQACNLPVEQEIKALIEDFYSQAGISRSQRKKAARRRIKRRVSQLARLLLGSVAFFVIGILGGIFFQRGDIIEKEEHISQSLDPVHPWHDLSAVVAGREEPLSQSLVPTPEPFQSEDVQEQVQQEAHIRAGENTQNSIQRAVTLLKGFFPAGGDFPMRVWSAKGKDTVYVEGEKLQIHILPETNAYLQVDYYQADGTVVHLLPNPLDNNFVEGGKTFTIGNPEKNFQFVFTPPFGEELLTVIASQKPLEGIREHQSMVEPAAVYLDQLIRHLPEHKAKGKMTAMHLMVRTQKR
jgi:hypothetical protein